MRLDQIAARHSEEKRRGDVWNPHRGRTIDEVLASYEADRGKVVLRGEVNGVVYSRQVFAISVDVDGKPEETCVCRSSEHLES